MGLSISSIGKTLTNLGHDVSDELEKDLQAIEKHPGYLAALMAGPFGPIAAASLGRHVGGGKATRPKMRGPAVIRPLGKNNGYQCGLDPTTGQPMEGREPFTFKSRLQLSGAQATATDLGDFFTTAASTDLSSNNAFAFTFDVDDASLFISNNYNNAVGALVETVAVIMGLKLIERRYNAQEQWQFGLEEFEPVISTQGNSGTPTATAPAKGDAIFEIDSAWVPFDMRYVTQEQWQIVLRTIRAFTPVGLLDSTLGLRGTRGGNVRA